jgi:hypothetical protein
MCAAKKHYAGRHITRELCRTVVGNLINADVNAVYNIVSTRG